jgi:hypothetical protein
LRTAIETSGRVELLDNYFPLYLFNLYGLAESLRELNRENMLTFQNTALNKVRTGTTQACLDVEAVPALRLNAIVVEALNLLNCIVKLGDLLSFHSRSLDF